MKTPEEIKQGLECCGSCEDNCVPCPYFDICDDAGLMEVERDALEYIVQLESSLAQAERERDVAIAQLKELDCATCARMDINEFSKYCRSCRNASNWQWRDVCAENTKEGK